MTLSCCKKVFALFRGIKSNHGEEVFCLNCFHSFRTKIKLKNHDNLCKNYDYGIQKYLKKIIKY